MDFSERFSNKFLLIFLGLTILVVCLLALVPVYNTEIIVMLQNASPALDTVFIAISYLGEPLIAIIIIVLIYWVYNKQIAKNLTSLLLGSVYLNNILKDSFRDPRPTGNQIVTETSYGFPSGHAQNATVSWGFLGYTFRKTRWFSIIALVLIALISISRLYLGVHDLQDVLGGLLIGAVLLLLFLLIEPDLSSRMSKLKLPIQFILAIIIPILLFIIVVVLFPGSEGDYGLVCGAMVGVSVGYIIETQYIDLNYSQTRKYLLIRAVLGLVIVFGVYFAFNLFDLETQLFDFISYLMIGLVATIPIPYIFTKIDKKSGTNNS